MAQDRAVLMTAESTKGYAWFGPDSRDSIRAENSRLRRLLAKADDVASRYAVMQRECDHRIKNSLQIVSGLIYMQARREESPSAGIALRAAAARIQSIARIHDALQASQGEDAVALGDVLEIMCKSLQEMAGDPLAVEVLVHAEPIQAPVTLAQPIVLAVNELVVNALRHAFPAGRAGTVLVSVTQADGELRVVVADDGVGLPDAYTEGSGYGMTLVRAMAKQIGGALHVENKGGARFTLTAPARALQPVG